MILVIESLSNTIMEIQTLKDEPEHKWGWVVSILPYPSGISVHIPVS